MVERGHGERVALRWAQDCKPAAMTYRELAALTNRVARVLVEDMKLVPGNRLLLRGPNNPMMAAAWLAAIKAGLVTVPTMPLLRAKELKQIIDKAQIQAVLCDVRLKDEARFCAQPDHEHHCPGLAQIMYFNDTAPDALDALAAGKPDDFTACDTAADDVCLIAFTSGTTGAPTGCMHFHRDVLAMCDLFPKHVIKPGPDDIFCGTPPLAFTFGLGGLQMCIRDSLACWCPSRRGGEGLAGPAPRRPRGRPFGAYAGSCVCAMTLSRVGRVLVFLRCVG